MFPFLPFFSYHLKKDPKCSRYIDSDLVGMYWLNLSQLGILLSKISTFLIGDHVYFLLLSFFLFFSAPSLHCCLDNNRFWLVLESLASQPLVMFLMGNKDIWL